MPKKANQPRNGFDDAPQYLRLLSLVLNALRTLGGKATPKQVCKEIANSPLVTKEDLEATGKDGRSQLEKGVHFARLYLKNDGLIDSGKRGVWQLTPKGRETHLDYDAAIVLSRRVKRNHGKKSTTDEPSDEAEIPTEDDTGADEVEFSPYGIDDIVENGCFLSRETLESAESHLTSKLNLILQGPPGTGKTWLAKRLGYALIGTKNRAVIQKRMRTIQFHPSLSYEDFVRGWRPDGNGKLSLIDGIFLESVEKARAEPDQSFVVIIEEINRGNPAQIFGEMLTLLEKDKRSNEEAIELAYRRQRSERVFIPHNLYVIGTMNIADRSLALIDLALRRRFAFVTLETALNESWRKWCIEQSDIEEGVLIEIQTRITELNGEIAADRSLGAQFQIGHSYVTPTPGEAISDARAWFRGIVETEIAPLLEEYWFDNLDKAKSSTKRLLQGL